MDNRELERALMAVKDKLDRLDVKLAQIEVQMKQLEEGTAEVRGGIKVVKALAG